MSAFALAKPLMAFKIKDKPVLVWHWSHTNAEKEYFTRFIDGFDLIEDDIRDQIIIELKEFEFWQRKPGF